MPTTSDRREERRLMLEAIIDDPAASHSDRLKADEQLRELEHDDARHASVDQLTPEQVLEELAAFGLPGAVAVHLGPEHVVSPESDATQLQQTIGVLRATERRLQSARETLAVCRSAFEELLGTDDPGAVTVEKVAEALRRIHEEDVADAEVVDERRGLPDGSR